ncbi:MAG: hypothetical protein ACN4GZ_09670 [Acidimicrobiales bacterium]
MRIRVSTYNKIERSAPISASLGSAAMIVAMFLGWFRSGTTMRNSFEMFRIPQQLGLEGFTTIRLLWFLMPVFAAGVVGFIALGRNGPATLLSALQGLVGLTVGIIVLFSDLDSGLGPFLATGSGLVLIASSIGMLVTAGDPS